MQYIKTVEAVNNLLVQNSEWIVRYIRYADEIINNQSKHIESRGKFRAQTPFYLYTCISNLLNKNVLKYDLRFLGQSVASIKIKNGNVVIHTKKNQRTANLRYFGVDIPLNNEKWNSYKAKKFRCAFNRCTSIQGRSNEHKIEALLLNEFRKKDGRAKPLRNIQPVVLANSFYQMPTPVKASLKDITYSAEKGGGIDILAHVKHKNNSVRLCVMELKDEYNNSEPPQKVMTQAVAYATFIAHLLRSESGNKWYKLFGFSKDIPEKLTIDVSIVMPSVQTEQNEDFSKEIIEVMENTYIELYSLYFRNKASILGEISYEFEGSLKDEML